jgi:hypothetical protein
MDPQQSLIIVREYHYLFLQESHELFLSTPIRVLDVIKLYPVLRQDGFSHGLVQQVFAQIVKVG